MFYGSIVALITPMDESGLVDRDALLRLLDLHLGAGTSGLVIGGTTGESATLSQAEFEQLLGLAIEHVQGQVPVIAGTGSPDTRTAVERSRRAQALGADAALVVTPYYNRPPQAGLAAHYQAIAAATRLPLIPYNVPSRTGVDLLPETLAGLAPADRFVAVKEAVPGPQRVGELVQKVGARMAVLSGDDGSCLQALELGCQGVISVAANVAPAHMSRLCAAMAAGDHGAAVAINKQLSGLFSQLAVESNPIPVKWAAYRMGLIKPGLRLPLLPLAQSLRPGLEQSLEKLGLLPAMKQTFVC
jgi:4-hydroxy-tetrahydrodipicolinate synthase